MIGTVLANRYELMSVLSDGPVFSVWSARDVTSGRDVCLRILKSPCDQEPAFVSALNKALDRYRKASSPYLEPMQRVISEDAYVFVVGELTRGPSLADRIRKLAPFSVQVSVGMGISLCRALEPLHRHSLAHGDVSSGHAIVLANGDIRLQMAGLWEAYGGSEDAGRAVLPMMAPYLAPEVAEGQMPSPASDIYAVGILMFELLTGRPPYYADTPLGLINEHRTREVPSVRGHNASVPDVLDRIVQKAMAKNPEARYQDASALLSDLRLVQEALRFGKSITWPLRPEDATEVGIEPGPVAPKMSAIRDENAQEAVKKRRRERDVPVWMLMLLTFFAAVLITLVAFWSLDTLRRPKTVRVPDIRNLSISEARTMLTRLKLDLRIQEKEANEKVEVDRILRVNPEPGRDVREGGTVNVVVSSGSTYVQMPDVKNETIDSARNILENLNLSPDSITEQRSSNDVEFGRVLGTDPPVRSKVLRASKVKLVVSAGSVTQPSEITKSYVYTLHVKVAGVDQRTTVKIELSDIQGARTVYEGSHIEGDMIDFEATGFGTSATFRIYYDDQVVKEFEKKADER